MAASLIPRFNYTMPLKSYLGALTKRSKVIHSQVIPDQDSLYLHNSARTGLRLLLSSIGRQGIRVGVQAYTCHSVFKAIHKAGHSITFIDIDENFQLSLEDLAEKASDIDALIVTHTFGNPDRYEAIAQTLGGGKVIIEDCAHAFGSQYADGTYAGYKADAAIFSFGMGKLPPIGQTGATLINNPAAFPVFEAGYQKLVPESKKSSLINLIKIIIFSVAMRAPWYGLVTRRLGKRLDKQFDFIDKFGFHESPGFAINQRVFETNQDRFISLVQDGQANFHRLSEGLEVPLVMQNNPEVSGANRYIVALLVNDRNQLFDDLLAQNIEPGKHFYQSLDWAEEFGYELGGCPNTEVLRKKIITIPVHAGVKPRQIDKIRKTLNLYGKKA